jgi:hypothetical protein
MVNLGYNSIMRRNKRDTAEHEIVVFWRSIGATWIPMGPEVGFDGLLIYRGAVYIVEIKTPGPWKLTPNEVATSQRCEFQGVRYHIVETVEAAGAMIGLDVM